MEENKQESIIFHLRKLQGILNNTTELLNNDKSDIIEILNNILEDISEVSINEVTSIIFQEILSLMLLKQDFSVINSKVAKVIAEISKINEGREKCTNIDIIKGLLNLSDSENIEVLIQVSRALGNICYENEKGRKLIKELNGLYIIHKLLKKSINHGKMEGGSSFRKAATGLLLNFFIDQENLDKMIKELDVIPEICCILESEMVKEEDVATFALLTLEVLDDNEIIFLNERLIKIIVNIFNTDVFSELSEKCLELLPGQIKEQENLKLLLAKAGIIELLLELLEKYGSLCNNTETKYVKKSACHLIVLILTGDDSMHLLFNESKGNVYIKLISWLENSDEDLQITAALAIGNFARSDANCKCIVSQGIHKKLMKLLSTNDNKHRNIKFQHAVLSSLKNLVIPSDNKTIMINDGLIDVLYPMLDILEIAEVFQLLGIFRIVIDGQKETAITLGKKEKLIKKTIELCSVENHQGVKGEAHRLIAWIINNSKNTEVMSLIIKNGAIKCLVRMLESKHPRMLNEATISLALIAATCLSEAEEDFIESKIEDILNTFFETNASNVESPIICNMLTFIENLIKSGLIWKHLNRVKLLNSLEKYVNGLTENNYQLREKIEKLCIPMSKDIIL